MCAYKYFYITLSYIISKYVLRQVIIYAHGWEYILYTGIYIGAISPVIYVWSLFVDVSIEDVMPSHISSFVCVDICVSNVILRLCDVVRLCMHEVHVSMYFGNFVKDRLHTYSLCIVSTFSQVFQKQL